MAKLGREAEEAVLKKLNEGAVFTGVEVAPPPKPGILIQATDTGEVVVDLMRGEESVLTMQQSPSAAMDFAQDMIAAAIIADMALETPTLQGVPVSEAIGKRIQDGLQAAKEAKESELSAEGDTPSEENN